MTASVLKMAQQQLQDVADAFGGHTRERRLEIMRDSRVGTYGACALSMSILLRTAVLASVAAPAAAAPVLIAAHTAARAGMPLFMGLVPPARVDGLAVGVGRPLPMSIAAAVLLGVIALFVALGALAGYFSTYDSSLPALGGPNALLYDLTLKMAQPWRRHLPAAPVVLVAIDDASLAGPELAALPRALLQPVWARLIDGLLAAGARRVG